MLEYAACAAKWKEPPRDALDTLVLGTVDMERMEKYTLVRAHARPSSRCVCGWV